jgi:outer membrane immunogenic protein
MRRLVLSFLASSVCLAVALPQIASAADMPLKAPAKVAAAVYNWTGFYIGGHVGAGWDDQTHVRLVANANYPVGFTSTDQLSGGLAGIQGGFNYQFMPQFLLGIESDATWSKLGDTDTTFSPCPVGPGCINPRIAAGRFSTHDRFLDEMVDVTGRLGWLPQDQVLIYAKGGAVWARTGNTSSTFNANGTLRTTNVSDPSVIPGWIIGGGVEVMLPITPILAKNLTFKVEYNYIRLNNHSGGCSTEVGGPNATIGLVSCGDNSTDNTVQVIKGGINLLFNPWSGGSVMSRY